MNVLLLAGCEIRYGLLGMELLSFLRILTRGLQDGSAAVVGFGLLRDFQRR